MVNEEMLKRVMKRIEREEASWDQNTWGSLRGEDEEADAFVATHLPGKTIEYGGWTYHLLDQFTPVTCNTTFCLAGHAVLEAGDEILFPHDDNHATLCRDREGNIHFIEERACDLLGLGDTEEDIFSDQGWIMKRLEVTAENEGWPPPPPSTGLTVEQFKRYITDRTGVEFD